MLTHQLLLDMVNTFLTPAVICAFMISSKHFKEKALDNLLYSNTYLSLAQFILLSLAVFPTRVNETLPKFYVKCAPEFTFFCMNLATIIAPIAIIAYNIICICVIKDSLKVAMELPVFIVFIQLTILVSTNFIFGVRENFYQDYEQSKLDRECLMLIKERGVEGGVFRSTRYYEDKGESALTLPVLRNKTSVGFEEQQEVLIQPLDKETEV